MLLTLFIAFYFASKNAYNDKSETETTMIALQNALIMSFLVSVIVRFNPLQMTMTLTKLNLIYVVMIAIMFNIMLYIINNDKINYYKQSCSVITIMSISSLHFVNILTQK